MRFFLLTSLSLLTILASGHGAPPSSGSRPNVLLLCVDDLKPVLGCYGDTLAKTPNLDRLASRGMRFDLAYCNQAVCAPSRNNLMLGSRSTSLGIYGLRENFREAVPNAVTLTQYFMNHGWRAEGVGKILHKGHGNHDDPGSWSVPFQPESVVEYRDTSSPTAGQLTREEAYFTNQHLGRIGTLPRGPAWEALDLPDNAYADGRIADEGVKRLQDSRQRPETPFFLALGFVKPHLPFTAPRKYWELYDRSRFVLPTLRSAPEGAPGYAGKTLGELNNYEPIPQRPPLSEEIRRQILHGYYASMSYADAQIGRVVEELDRLKMADNTIIILWGDHGWHLGDHGMWTKHTNYEQANHIPLLVVAPGVTQPGTHTQQLAETVDIYPTLVELAGLDQPNAPQPMDGVSLVPVLKDPEKRVRDHAYHAFPRQRDGKQVIGRSIRTERYRLVEWKVPGEAANTADLELYDYQADPAESRNLAKEKVEVVAELRKILGRHPEAKTKPGA
ncbi:sulfatase [Verrucomicrobium spinosum]|uniref:sulfatase n=1 Tax=Verrucomicrobium spinosum TaxID=2736 RepID=UPI0001744623|nr:sulfatase [Verrucomicrobium spinosum]